MRRIFLFMPDRTPEVLASLWRREKNNLLACLKRKLNVKGIFFGGSEKPHFDRKMMNLEGIKWTLRFMGDPNRHQLRLDIAGFIKWEGRGWEIVMTD